MIIFCSDCGKGMREVHIADSNAVDDIGFYCKKCRKFFIQRLVLVDVEPFNKFFFTDEQSLKKGYGSVKKREVIDYV